MFVPFSVPGEADECVVEPVVSDWEFHDPCFVAARSFSHGCRGGVFQGGFLQYGVRGDVYEAFVVEFSEGVECL